MNEKQKVIQINEYSIHEQQHTYFETPRIKKKYLGECNNTYHEHLLPKKSQIQNVCDPVTILQNEAERHALLILLTDLNFIKSTANSWTSPLPHKTELASSFIHKTMDID